MSPEELEAAREGANVDYAPDISYDDWQAMAKALLAHIDDHEAYIASLKGELEIAGQRLREMSLKKDEFALMQALETRKEQIEALKEKLVEERAQVLAGKGNLIWEPLPDDDRPDGLYPALVIRGKAYWRTVAHQQIEAEMVGVEWEC